jgi:hypothetical protein
MAVIPTPGIDKKETFYIPTRYRTTAEAISPVPHVSIGLYLRRETPLHFANFLQLKICSEERQQEINPIQKGQ